MTFVLIDTSSWKQLISKFEVNPDLSQLYEWTIYREVTILVPEALTAEWRKHRDEEKTKISKAIERRAKTINLFGLSEDLINDANLDRAKSTLEHQVNLVDMLLQAGEHVGMTPEIKIMISDALQQRLAPFHNKVDSHSDASLIFSALDHATKNGIDQIIFASANHTDFGSLNSQKRILHTDISRRFPGVNVLYLDDVRSLCEFLKAEAGLLPTVANDSGESKSHRRDLVQIDTSKSMLLQVYQYLEFRFRALNYYPVNLLRKEYPFKVNERFWVDYYHFSISTDNDILFDFFNAIKLKADGSIEIDESKKYFIDEIPDWTQKTRKILRALNRNSIFFIRNSKQTSKVDIRFYEKVYCNCVRCHFLRFEFDLAFKQLALVDKSSSDELLKAAYIKYRFGDFLGAYDIYKELLNAPEFARNPELRLIVKYNLVNLRVFIRNYHWGPEQQDAVTDEISKIDLDSEVETFKDSKFESFARWLIERSFLNDVTTEFGRKNSEIRDNYGVQTSGGWASNSNPLELINQYAQLDAFLGENCIIFDRFSDYSMPFNWFTEGIIAAHAIPGNQGTKLSVIDDYVIKSLLYHGDPDSIIKFINRYDLKEIVYKKSTEHDNSFFDLVNNFLTKYEATAGCFKEKERQSNAFFWEHYGKVFSNLMILGGLLKVPPKDKVDLVNKVVEFLWVEDVLNHRHLGHITIFFERLNQNIEDKTLSKLLDLILTKQKYHDEDYFYLVGQLLSSHKPAITISDEQFDLLQKTLLESCAVCKEVHRPELICPFYKAFDVNQKRIIRRQIEGLLSHRFDAELFYKASMYEIISPSPDQVSSFIESSIPTELRVTDSGPFHAPVSFNRNVNKLINFCYKFRISLKDSRFESVAKISPYYLWLTDMDTFDYSEFDVRWIAEYTSHYYLEEVKKQPIIEKLIVEYLRDNRDERISRLYLRVFGVWGQ